MKLNRKGFMLAEVTIVSVIVTTVLVTLFTGLNSLSAQYNTRNRYHDIDCLYIAMEVNEILNDRADSNNITVTSFTDVINFATGTKKTNYENYIGYYNGFTLDNVKAYISPYRKDALSSSSESPSEKAKDFLQYLQNRLDFSEDYDYIIIVERQNDGDSNDCYYYALKLKNS